MADEARTYSSPENRSNDNRIIWFFGRSGSGKTTLASQIVQHYAGLGISCLWLDGDRVREGLSRGLGFSIEDRLEHHRRIIEMANIAIEQGFIVVISAIAPLVSIRSQIDQLSSTKITWIYLDPGESTCRARDTKGLYSRGTPGQFTQLFESPVNELIGLQLNTAIYGVEYCIKKIITLLESPATVEPVTFNI